jgi:hypothetical protein
MPIMHQFERTKRRKSSQIDLKINKTEVNFQLFSRKNIPKYDVIGEC